MRYLLNYRKGNKKSGCVALTFDDGPSAWTGRILDILKERRIKATFFLIPENIEKLPAMAKRILAEGHEIGAHAAQPDGRTRWQALRAKASEDVIVRAVETAKRMLGLDPRFFRPSPELAFNRGTENILKRLDLVPVLASAYSRVTRPVDVQICYIAERLRGGAIILLHDGHDLLTESDRPKDTLEVLPAVIASAEERNLKFVKVSELLEIPPYKN